MSSPNPSAVAKAERPTDLATAGGTMDIARRDDVERYESVIDLPASFQYVIPKRQKVAGKWVDVIGSIGITSDGYDYLNRVLGVSFFLPDFVPDENGEMVRNPIHRRDYIYIRMGAIWYNETGQLVSATEDLEVDYILTYQSARLEAPEAEVAIDENGQPLFDENGNAMIRMVGKAYRGDDDGPPGQDREPPDPKIAAAKAEKKALKALMQLRTMGMRYAQTVLRTRLIKIAVGVKSLPVKQGQTGPQTFRLRVVGFKDKMTPLERQVQAGKALGAMFGGARPVTPERMSASDMADIEGFGAEESIDRVVLEATGVPVARNVTPDGEIVEGVEEDAEFELPVSG